MCMQLNYEDLKAALNEKKSITKFGSLICVKKQIPDSDGAGELDPRVVQLMNESASKMEGTTGFPDLSAISPEHFPIEALRAAMGFPNQDITKSNIRVEHRIR